MRPNGLIPNLTVSCDSPILRIKIESRYALPHWQLGAWATFNCMIKSQLTRLSSRSCILQEWCLLEFSPPNNSNPYKLILDFPRWIIEADIEIQQFINPSGIYLNSELSALQVNIQGEDFPLVNPQYLNVTGSPNLIMSRFIVNLVWEKFEISRLKSLDSGQIIPDPSISIAPYKVQFDFVSDAQISANKITANIKPRI
ncbi:MAG: hypothetical protein U7123_07280 [Potamolinea sp.]